MCLLFAHLMIQPGEALAVFFLLAQLAALTDRAHLLRSFFVKLFSSVETTCAEILLINDGSQVWFTDRLTEAGEGVEGESAKAREEEDKSWRRR